MLYALLLSIAVLVGGLGLWFFWPYVRTYWVRWYPNHRVITRYRQSGLDFAHALTDSMYGRNQMLPYHYLEWKFWEIEYARRGFKTIELNVFMEPQRYRKIAQLDVRRAPDESVTYHAQSYLDDRDITFHDLLCD